VNSDIEMARRYELGIETDNPIAVQLGANWRCRTCKRPMASYLLTHRSDRERLGYCSAACTPAIVPPEIARLEESSGNRRPRR
jgi:hypothetical protein